MLSVVAPNKIDCYITYERKWLSETDALAYWVHWQVTKKIGCCECDSGRIDFYVFEVNKPLQAQRNGKMLLLLDAATFVITTFIMTTLTLID
jgi:hypothetical protein